jgi:hypothetical protein
MFKMSWCPWAFLALFPVFVLGSFLVLLQAFSGHS